MPNTLCHIALQAPICNSVLKTRDLPWVLVGCLLPDLPWIGLKLLLLTQLFNPYNLRLYFTAQASLFFCLLLAASICFLSKHSLRVFLILGLNSLLHLLFDGLQIKWGNGVHLLAPFNWHMTNLGLLWPEHMLTTALTILGLLYLVIIWRPILNTSQSVQSNPISLNANKIILSFLLLGCYMAAPFLFFGPMEKVDTYYLSTMKQENTRPGKAIEFDRAVYSVESRSVQLYSGEIIFIEGVQPNRSGRVSFSGLFLTKSSVLSKSYHYHQDHRDIATMVGLFLTCTLLAQSLILPRIKNNNHQG